MASGINGRTKICGIIGYPVGHSFSPVMQNAAFSAAGLDYAYVPFPVEPGDVKEAVKAVKAFGLVGVNVTIPHKETVLPLLDQLSEEARLTGAVNTIVNHSGRLCGYNTDGEGFWRSLGEVGFLPAGKTVLILGAGGAARAVAVAAALAGIKRLMLANRTEKRARELACFIAEKTGLPADVIPWPEDKGGSLLGEALSGADLVVQATRLGMHPNEAEVVPIPYDRFKPGQVACDLVYNPMETMFLRKAGQSGAAAVSGLGMLLHQGALSFELWTGAAAPLEVMRKELLKEVTKQKTE
ncbi:shikimate dehydrogenase [Pelotomaculum propionicicum]|uniref:Shikimate dehydrogenase (NADP(+)) n=1 Tax=Pelotomaculum propionicicum TaxID=258475 RepID=A0A4Y7RL63_9FIRM|nr:shikimate dehydrogenase [Pelotomaculum propionicicum]NLI11374.1 shikimate dehydrogenase [Peptococcaceae bacterium]TEB09593.1 Shikimate dehydrogenase (NADP(+)) [Pelotomaculum propionicicum]